MKRTNVQERGCEISRITKEKAQTVYSMDEYAQTFINSNMPLPYYYTLEQKDDWDIVEYYTGVEKKRMTPDGNGDETVYIMRNPLHQDGLYKIGFTSKDPEVRRKQLSRSTGVPVDFETLYVYNCYNGKKLEGLVHKALKDYRYNMDKEFFMVDLDTIKETIQTLGKII